MSSYMLGANSVQKIEFRLC